MCVAVRLVSHATEVNMLVGDQQFARARGFTYVAMLFALAIFSIGLAVLGETWSRASQRDKEEELILIGNAYVKAIGQYYERSPGVPKAYPRRLDELTEDLRFVGTMRHLRRAYRDPVTQQLEWGLLRGADGGIIGIHSLSDKIPMRKQAFTIAGSGIVGGVRYADWHFVYHPNSVTANPSSGQKVLQ